MVSYFFFLFSKQIMASTLWHWISLHFIVTRLWYSRPLLFLSLLRVLLNSAVVLYSFSLSEFYLSVSFYPYMWDSIIDNGDREKGFPESGLRWTSDKKERRQRRRWLSDESNWGRNWINFSLLLRFLFEQTKDWCCSYRSNSFRWRELSSFCCLGMHFFLTIYCCCVFILNSTLPFFLIWMSEQQLMRTV